VGVGVDYNYDIRGRTKPLICGIH